jgi:hypothetical protein
MAVATTTETTATATASETASTRMSQMSQISRIGVEKQLWKQREASRGSIKKAVAVAIK